MPRPSKPHLTKRGSWRVRVNGQEHYLGTNEQKAWAKYHRLMAEAKSQPEGTPRTVAALIDSWLEQNPSEDNAWRLDDFNEFAGRRCLLEVNCDTLVAYLKCLKKRTYHPGQNKQLEGRRLAPKTIIDRMRLAFRVLKWAHKQGWIAEEPEMPKLPKPVRRTRDVRSEPLSKAFDDLPECSVPIFKFILFTGCRPSEARLLQWESINLQRRNCVVDAHKTASQTGKPRTIYLTPEALEVLEAIPHREDYVFVNRLGKPYTSSGLRSILQRRGITPYQLRHTFAQNASEQIEECELAKLMGHKDPATTRFYYEVRNKRAQSAADSLSSPLQRHSPAQSPLVESADSQERQAQTALNPPQAKRQVS